MSEITPGVTTAVSSTKTSNQSSPSLEQDFFAKTGKPVSEVSNAAAITKIPDLNPVPAPRPEIFRRQAFRPERTLVADSTTLRSQIESIGTKPSDFSPDQVTQILKDAYAGRTLEKIRQTEPELAESLLNLEKGWRESSKDNAISLLTRIDVSTPNGNKNLAVEQLSSRETPLLLAPDTVIDSQRLNQDELEIEFVTPDNQRVKMTTSNILFSVACVAADLALFRGRYTFMALQSSIQPLAQEISHYYLSELGFQIPENAFDRTIAYDKVVENMPTEKFVDFLEELPAGGIEIFRFLEGMKDDERNKMLAGERFGGAYGKHQLNHEQIATIVSKLNSYQKQMLGIQSA